MTTPALDQKTLKRLLSYDPNTGVFVWLPRPGERWPAAKFVGNEAGNLWAGSPRVTYRVINLLGWPFYAHRLAFLYITGDWPVGVVDHVDRDGLNNSWSNLRDASKSLNAHNAAPQRNNRSGFRGVGFDKRRGRFYARLHSGPTVAWLGYFPTAAEAGEAYETALLQKLADDDVRAGKRNVPGFDVVEARVL